MRRKFMVTAIAAALASFAAIGQQVQDPGDPTAMSTFDADNDGYVSREEAEAHGDLTELWDELDLDRDEQLNEDEFAGFEQGWKSRTMKPTDEGENLKLPSQ